MITISMEDDNPLFVGDEANAADDYLAGIQMDGQGDSGKESSGPALGLIPPMITAMLADTVRNADLSAATFGYDISKLEERPWAKPDANLKDFFNYGFNEKTWRIFCAMQSEGESSLCQRAEDFYRKIEGLAEERSMQSGNNMMMNSSNGRDHHMHPSMGGPPPFNGGNNMQGNRETRDYSSSMFFKTKICHKFNEGKCTRGEACNYAHGAHELRAHVSLPPMNGGGGGGGSGDGVLHNGGGVNGGNFPPRMPYLQPSSIAFPRQQHEGNDGQQQMGGNDGILSMPLPAYANPPALPRGPPSFMPDMGSFPPGMVAPMNASMPPPGVGFRMAPQKRDRPSDSNTDGVFERQF